MFFFFSLISCHEYLIKLLGRNLFLQGQESIQGLPNVGSRKDANIFIFKGIDKEISKRLIYVKDLPNQVLDIPAMSTKLIFYPMHGFHNQRFEIVPTDMVRGYRIVFDGKCLGWVPDEKMFRIEMCTQENLNQMFEMICSDCPGRKNTLINSPPVIVDSYLKETEHFLNESTKKLIKEIGKLTVDMNNCFINNGTCKSLDNNHIQLNCYTPFGKPIEPTELWPDLKADIRHAEDYPSEPLGIIGDHDGFIHYQRYKQDEKQSHIDSKHPEYFKNHLDNLDHVHKNEDIYHDNLNNIGKVPVNPSALINSDDQGILNGLLKNVTNLSKLNEDIIKSQRFMVQADSEVNQPKVEDPIIPKKEDEKPMTSKKIIDLLKPQMNELKDLNLS